MQNGAPTLTTAGPRISPYRRVCKKVTSGNFRVTRHTHPRHPPVLDAVVRQTYGRTIELSTGKVELATRRVP
ncbi:hypothetical protein GCM10028815_32360 [Mariniluteicoccus flavus]